MQKEKQLEHDNGAWVKARNITTDTGNPKTDKDNSALEACAMGQTILWEVFSERPDFLKLRKKMKEKWITLFRRYASLLACYLCFPSVIIIFLGSDRSQINNWSN